MATEADIFSLSVLWLDEFVQWEFELIQKAFRYVVRDKKLYQAKRRTSSCHSCRPGGQHSRCLSLLIFHVCSIFSSWIGHPVNQNGHKL